MDKVGVLVVSKRLSSAAIIDTFMRSSKYSPQFYVVENQANPFNLERAKVHRVVPDLNLDSIAKFAARHRDKIAFGLTDTEDFVVSGGRDVIEERAGVPMLCVTKKYAVEGSKADQRLLFARIFEAANPRFRVFSPEDYPSPMAALGDLKSAFAEIGALVIKPDAPARGAGVGVWGSDFRTEKEMASFFLSVLSKGRAVVEEKVEGEESSFQAFSDGKHFIPAPMTRDYKRSMDRDAGRLTGGMGSYRGSDNFLPFLRKADWKALVAAEEGAFRRWKGRGSDPGLRGIVLYDAIMHTAEGFKVLERNSRGGNTEIINVLTTIADDLADVCHRMVDGSLKGIRFRREASVVTCAVPRSYGSDEPAPKQPQAIDLVAAYQAAERSGGRVRVLPMDVRTVGSSNWIGTSRSVAVVGLGPSVELARGLSLQGVRALAGPLRWRRDIASPSDIERSRAHLESLRA